MGMPAQDMYWTMEMVRALPEDGNRYEVLDGTLLVSPSPSIRHQIAVALLYDIIAPYTRTNGIGRTLMSPADIELSQTRMVGPDLFVIPADVKTSSWKDVTRLFLTAEVLSPSTARWDRMEKRSAYQKKEIPEYWVVDLDTRVFERWLPSDVRPEILSCSTVRRRFAEDGSLGAFDFFSIVIWKANRAKSYVARRLLERDPERRSELEPIVRDLTRSLSNANSDQARMRILKEVWRFGLPMARAVLSILWPDDFTVYDVRVCEQLEGFQNLGGLTRFDAVWAGYSEYRRAVEAAVPGSLSLRDKDRHLWAKSTMEQLQHDIANGFSRD